MIKKRLLIRADGSTEIGHGHIVRCMSLAYMLKNDFNIVFVFQEIPPSIFEEILDVGFQTKKISNEKEFLLSIRQKDFVVLDGYTFNSEYQLNVKQRAFKLIVIDDLYDKVYYADLIINHAPGAKQAFYNAQPYTKFALGIEYALLRPKFLQSSLVKIKPNKIKSILVCFGASDTLNLTLKTLEIIKDFKIFHRIFIVVGLAYKHLSSIENLLISDTRIELHYGINENKMIDLLNEADLALVPASSVMLEALSQQRIVITGYYVENQIKAYFDALETGLIFGVGDFRTLNSQVLSKVIEEIIRRIKLDNIVFPNMVENRVRDVIKSLV